MDFFGASGGGQSAAAAGNFGLPANFTPTFAGGQTVAGAMAAMNGGAGVSGLSFGVGTSGSIGAQTAVTAAQTASTSAAAGGASMAAAAGPLAIMAAAFMGAKYLSETMGTPRDPLGHVKDVNLFQRRLESGDTAAIARSVKLMPNLLSIFDLAAAGGRGPDAQGFGAVPGLNARKRGLYAAIRPQLQSAFDLRTGTGAFQNAAKDENGNVIQFNPATGFENIEGMATGGSKLFTRPTLLTVAEQGPEFVTARPTANGGRGATSGTSVVFQGPAIVDPISLDRFIRSVDRGSSRRRARGI
jgi:hypothetical protein